MKQIAARGNGSIRQTAKKMLDPVSAPNSRRIRRRKHCSNTFERKAIISYLQTAKTCPCCKLPLAIEWLLPKREKRQRTHETLIALINENIAKAIQTLNQSYQVGQPIENTETEALQEAAQKGHEALFLFLQVRQLSPKGKRAYLLKHKTDHSHEIAATITSTSMLALLIPGVLFAITCLVQNEILAATSIAGFATANPLLFAGIVTLIVCLATAGIAHLTMSDYKHKSNYYGNILRAEEISTKQKKLDVREEPLASAVGPKQP